MSDPFLAEIVMCGCNFAPRAWAFCDGQILSINNYQALYSLLGTTFGGDGRTSFGLPELRGRVPMGVGTGAGLATINWGEKGGAETVSLQATNLPQHNHSATGAVNSVSTDGNQRTPTGFLLAKDRDNSLDKRFTTTATANSALDDAAVSVTVGDTGNSSPVQNRQPFQALNYIICLQGMFPSRN